MSSNELSTDGLPEFIEEVSEQLNSAEGLLLNWGTDGAPPDAIDQIFRTFHNVKGTSGMFGLRGVVELFHQGESLLSLIREKRVSPTPDMIDSLVKVIDEFKSMTKYTIENRKEPDEKPYALLGAIVEGRKALLAAEAGQASGEAQSGERKKEKAEESIRITSQNATELVEIVSDFIQLQNRLDAVLGADGSSTSLRNDMVRFSSRLQKFVLDIRLAPVQPLLSGLQRVANQATRDLGQKVRMQITGGDTQLDRRVLDLLRDPLIHMVRNAIDHGIETPDTRAAAKKPSEGLIVIEAAQQSGQVILSRSDDGKGIDAEKVKGKAVEKGFITKAQADAMSTNEAVKLIFLPGFSTAAKVTDLSGRGVGMDSVKSSVEGIGGSVDIDSELGRGTKVTLTLPLTLAIVKSLAFFVGKRFYAVPQMNVEEVITESMANSRDQLGIVEGGGKVLHLRKSVIPVISLQKIFSEPEPATGQAVFIVVRHRNSRFALQADRISGPRDFVSQPLPSVFSAIDFVSGVNQLNSGDYIGLLDLHALGGAVEGVGLQQKQSTGGTSEEQMNQSDIFRSQQKLVFFNSGRRFAVAVQAIRQVIQVPATALDVIGERPYLTYNGKTYPILRLWQTFNNNDALEKRDVYTCLLVQREGKHAAIVCDAFFGIDRLPREFETLVRAHGIQGSVNYKDETFLVVNVHHVFGMEFPNDFKSRGNLNSKFHVLVVEDDSFFATNLSEFLEHEGFTVTIAKDGLEAKEYLEHSLDEKSGAQPVDYVITDYEMPRMTGLELLSWMRNRSEFLNLSATMCTAVGDDSTKKAAMKFGIDYFSGKMKYENILPYLRKRANSSAIGVSTVEPLENAGNVIEDIGAQGRVLTFAVGGRVFGIEIKFLKEISAASPATPVPSPYRSISQMIGFRGQPIPVMDLRVLLKAPANSVPQQVVAQIGGQVCALWVDNVLHVKRLQSLDRSTGVIKEVGEGAHQALVGDVLWDQNGGPVCLIDGVKVERLLHYVKEKIGSSTVAVKSQRSA